MEAIIYGLVGHASSLRLPLDALDLDDLAVGREFTYHGRLYEIRSLSENGDTVLMNVVMILEDVYAPLTRKLHPELAPWSGPSTNVV